jgi:hypothetical protein
MQKYEFQHYSWRQTIQNNERTEENDSSERTLSCCSALPSCHQFQLINCPDEFQKYASVLERLHIRVSCNPLPREEVSYAGIFGMISRWTTSEVATGIAMSLQKHFESTKAEVTGFRASIIYSFSDDSYSWPVVEWKEGHDTEVIAIFWVRNWLSHTRISEMALNYGNLCGGGQICK